MSSFKVGKLKVDTKKRTRHLPVEFNLDGEGKRDKTFDANHLPFKFDDKGQPLTEEDKVGIDQYMNDWTKAYERGKAAVNPDNVG